jgi:UV DNA damage repair endonuclease
MTSTKESQMSTTSEKVTKHLEAAEHGTRWLERQTGIPASTLNRFILEGADAKWTVQQIVKIAAALEVPVDEVLPDSLLELMYRYESTSTVIAAGA